MNKVLRVIVGVHTLGISELVRASKEAQERRRIEAEIEQQRRNSSFTYNEYINEEVFERIVSDVVKSIKRIEYYSVYGPIVECSVRTQSGISNWEFKIDYNDFGKLTGRYWILEYGNYDSDIPKSVAERISKMVSHYGT